MPKLAPRVVGTRTAPVGGIVLSESCGEFETQSGDTTTWVDIRNLEVALTTTGRPVMLKLQPAPPTGREESYLGGVSQVTRANPWAYFTFSCDGVDLGQVWVGLAGLAQYHLMPPSIMSQVHLAPPGTHVYKLRARSGHAGAQAVANHCVLVAFEL